MRMGLPISVVKHHLWNARKFSERKAERLLPSLAQAETVLTIREPQLRGQAVALGNCHNVVHLAPTLQPLGLHPRETSRPSVLDRQVYRAVSQKPASPVSKALAKSSEWA